MNLMRFKLILILLLFSYMVNASDKFKIEQDYENLGSKLYLTVANIDGKNKATANTKLPKLGGEELMQIKYKPNGRNTPLFTIYYYRDGVLELYHEYHWQAPNNSFDFKKSKERKIEFKGSVVIKGREYLKTPQEEKSIVESSEVLYRAIKEKQKQFN